ncbi:MAG: butyrate kinase [Thermodesulfobacteriota bacterium]
MNKILVVNIGSTSTKVGLFQDYEPLFKETSAHTPEALSRLQWHDDWLWFHQACVDRVLNAHKQMLGSLALVVSRGGLSRPVGGGAYRIDETMLLDLSSGKYGWHPCNVGPAIAFSIASRYRVRAMVYDAPVTDELEPLARFSGLKALDREAASHVLNQKSAARKAAQDMDRPYENARFVVAHLGGGITIGAHRNGKIIDCTHGLSEGPFTPQRTGSLPLKQIIDLCFSQRYNKDELLSMFWRQGGVRSYLGTHDIETVEERIAKGDEKARLVLEAMAYQISKEIGAMAAVLKGNVDAVVLTGDLCRARTIMEAIEERIAFVGGVYTYPGEDELENLASGGFAVLTRRETMKEYGGQR